MKIPFVILLCFVSTLCLNAQSAQLPNTTQSSIANELPALLIFSGSDWCKPCIQLKKEVIDQAAFQSYAEGKLQIQIVDFPYRKANKLSAAQQASNNQLAERYNPQGNFPFMVLIDKNGERNTVVTARKMTSLIDELNGHLK